MVNIDAGYKDLDINTYMKCGIYKITIGDEFYIGSSKNIDQRWKAHTLACIGGRCNFKMVTAFQENSSLKFEILEECGEDNRIEREQHYIDTLKPSLNVAPVAGLPAGYSRGCRLKDPFGKIHEFESLTQVSVKHNLHIGSLSDLLNGKREFVKGWVRECDDHKKVKRRRGLIDPDNREVIINSVEDFCTNLQLSTNEISKVLNSKILHYRGWRLPENKHINHNFFTKKITKNGIILSYNHPSDLRQKPELKEYKLRPDSLRSLFKGLITNHQGWTIYKSHPE